MLKPVPRKSPSFMVSSIAQGRVSRYLKEKWWPGSESNQRHADFQSAALPTELPGRGAAHYKEAPRVCKKVAFIQHKARISPGFMLCSERLILRLESFRRFGTGAEEEFFHLAFDQLARLGVEGVQARWKNSSSAPVKNRRK